MYSLLSEQQKLDFIRIITTAAASSSNNVTPTIANIANMTTTGTLSSSNSMNIEMDGTVNVNMNH